MLCIKAYIEDNNNIYKDFMMNKISINFFNALKIELIKIIFKMQIHEYINEIKIYQNSILEFIENDDSSDENFGNLTNIIENSNILINKR